MFIKYILTVFKVEMTCLLLLWHLDAPWGRQGYAAVAVFRTMWQLIRLLGRGRVGGMRVQVSRRPWKAQIMCLCPEEASVSFLRAGKSICWERGGAVQPTTHTSTAPPPSPPPAELTTPTSRRREGFGSTFRHWKYTCFPRLISALKMNLLFSISISAPNKDGRSRMSPF